MQLVSLDLGVYNSSYLRKSVTGFCHNTTAIKFLNELERGGKIWAVRAWRSGPAQVVFQVAVGEKKK
jgi:hypothetical protein